MRGVGKPYMLQPNRGRMLRAVLAVLLVCLLPVATAQSQANAAWTISVESDASAPTIVLGGSQAVNVTVSLRLTNAICQGEGRATVALAIEDSGLPGVTASLPASVDVVFPAGGPAPVSTGTSTEEGVATMTINVAANSAPDHDHSFKVTATAPATLPTGCTAAMPPAEASADVDVAIKTGPAPKAAATGTGTQAVGTVGAQESFSLPLPLLLGALLVMARRR